jgi:hypothetical protein
MLSSNFAIAALANQPLPDFELLASLLTRTDPGMLSRSDPRGKRAGGISFPRREV